MDQCKSTISSISLPSLLLYQKTKLKSSSQSKNKISVLLIPSHSLKLQNRQQGLFHFFTSLWSRQDENLMSQSLIFKYLWQQTNTMQANYVNFKQSKYNSNSYNIKINTEGLSKRKVRSANLKGSLQQNKFNINGRLKRESLEQLQQPFDQEVIYDIWQAEGQQFGSTSLKFALRKKNIVLVVGSVAENNLREKHQKWSEFVRNSNKRCIIGNIIISERGKHQKVVDESYEIQISTSNKLSISHIPSRVNQYIVNLQCPLRQGQKYRNNERLLYIVDQIIKYHMSRCQQDQLKVEQCYREFMEYNRSMTLIEKDRSLSRLFRQSFCCQGVQCNEAKTIEEDKSIFESFQHNKIKKYQQL